MLYLAALAFALSLLIPADPPVRLPAPTVAHCEAVHGHWYDGACWTNYGG